MNNTARRNLIVGGTVLVGAGLSLAAVKLGGGTAGALIAFLLTVVVTVLSDFLARPWQELLNQLFATGRGRPVRVLAFAASGSGKSTLRERLLSPFPPSGKQPSTVKFSMRQNDVLIDVANDQRLRVIVADYAGDDPDQITQEKHLGFLGSTDQGKVDVIFFLIDIVPAEDDDNGNQLTDDQLIALYTKDDSARSRIAARISEQREYLNPWQINTIIKKCGSGSVQCVRLVISKVDLVQRLVETGHITLPVGPSVEEYLLDLYRDRFALTEGLCRDYGVKDYAYYCANLKSGESVIDDWKRILQKLYSERLAEEGKNAK